MKLSSILITSILANWPIPGQSIDPQQPLQQGTYSKKLSLLELHKSLVDISSITYNESAIAEFLASYLRSQSLSVESQLVSHSTQTQDARYNIFAYPGKQRQTHTLITSHIDTVPPFWPYERRGRDGRDIWGRGSVDAKGSVASQIKAVESLLASGSIGPGNIALLFVVGEETGGDGMRAVNNQGLSWKAVIFGEPTELKLAAGHKGTLGLTIRTHGKAGHSGYPELGLNANSMLIKALAVLEKLPLPSSNKYGNTTVNIGRMEGGVAGNVIAERAEAAIQIRIAGGTVDGVKKSITEALWELGEGYQIEFTHGYGPIDIDHDVSGFEKIVVNYGTDIPNLKGKHKKYLYGPGDILVAHSDHEHLDVSDLEFAVEGYKALILASLTSE